MNRQSRFEFTRRSSSSVFEESEDSLQRRSNNAVRNGSIVNFFRERPLFPVENREGKEFRLNLTLGQVMTAKGRLLEELRQHYNIPYTHPLPHRKLLEAFGVDCIKLIDREKAKAIHENFQRIYPSTVISDDGQLPEYNGQEILTVTDDMPEAHLNAVFEFYDLPWNTLGTKRLEILKLHLGVSAEIIDRDAILRKRRELMNWIAHCNAQNLYRVGDFQARLASTPDTSRRDAIADYSNAFPNENNPEENPPPNMTILSNMSSFRAYFPGTDSSSRSSASFESDSSSAASQAGSYFDTNDGSTMVA